MNIPVKLLDDNEIKQIHEMTKRGGSIPSHIVLQLLGHVEAIKTEAAIKIWRAKELQKNG